jgi:hypothetical protein
VDFTLGKRSSYSWLSTGDGVSANTITVFSKKQSLLLADELRYKKSRTPELSNYREELAGLLYLKPDQEVSLIRLMT